MDFIIFNPVIIAIILRVLPVRDSLQVIIIRVLRQSPVQERPGEVVHGVLFVLYGLGHDLRVHVVV